jgi:hypothetical protein
MKTMSVEDFYRTKYTYDDLRGFSSLNPDEYQRTYSVRKYHEDLQWCVENKKYRRFKNHGDILFNVSVIIEFTNKEGIESYITKFKNECSIDIFENNGAKYGFIKYVPDFHVNNNVLTISLRKFALPLVSIKSNTVEIFVPECDGDCRYYLTYDFVWIWNDVLRRKIATSPIIINMSETNEIFLCKNELLWKNVNLSLCINDDAFKNRIECEDCKFPFLTFHDHIKAVSIPVDLHNLLDHFLK